MIEIEIDGNKIQTQSGEMLIKVADDNGVEIPRFCYHKKLSVAANCRMCLIEVENSSKPMPACATPVADGMKVFTKSEKARLAQKSVMEFLLINHPLDCPICDQGGECDLQDLAVAYGNDYSRFDEPKRIIKDKNLGPLVATDMTRCINCTRCVRFGREVAGIVELGSIGRGEHTEISTYIEHSLVSELSGNIIDICPVGALTSKPFRYQARNWELTKTDSIAPHDALGSNVILESINGKIVRVLPKENDELNEVWLSDRDRFSYLGLYTDDRLLNPMVRNKEGELEEISWSKGLAIASSKLVEITDNYGEDALGMLMSPNCSVEEFYLAKKIMTSLEVENISCKLGHQNSSDITSYISCNVSDIELMDSVLIIGSNINQEVPLIASRIKKTQDKGASVNVLNPNKTNFSFAVDSQTTSADAMFDRLNAIKNTLSGEKTDDKIANKIAQSLTKSKKSLILIGQIVCLSSEVDGIYALAKEISNLANCDLGVVDLGANTKGAQAVGFANKNASQIVESSKGLVLFATELSLDSGINFTEKLKSTDFVLSFSSYLSEELQECADLILPIANYGETSGSFVNIQGQLQSFTGAIKPLGEARPGWKVLRVLGNYLKLKNFDYISSEEILKECDFDNVITQVKTKNINSQNILSVRVPLIYQTDSLVRRSLPLQETKLGDG